jgi:DHA1 family bicyclomycin/chloramphenicol resistance-like MFS transporter
MPDSPVAAQPTVRSFAEFVTIIAAAMALHALAIDAMLPALPAIGRSFTVVDDNQLQWIVTIFFIGAGFGQLVHGPLSDWLGRRPVLLTGLALYVAISLLAALATSLPQLLALRVAQGMAAAASNVVPRAVVRDCYSGARMARVLSMAFVVFLTAPILAPSVGQLLLLVMPWRGIFCFLAVCGALVFGWIAIRLPETHPRARRRPPNPGNLLAAARLVITEPSSIFYTLAMTTMFGSLLAYVSTVPQIFAGYFHQPRLMAIAFAFCAGTMGVASYCNSRIVERIGMHQISHVALIAFIVVTTSHALLAWTMGEGVVTFAVLQALTMACFGLAVSNFGAIAMQPMGAIAGSAGAVQGVISTIGGALVGTAIGQQWSGSVVFLPIGSLICGIAALVFVLLAENGTLFHRRDASTGRRLR